MKSLNIPFLAAVLVVTSAFAQTASLTADHAALAPSGGTIALTATVNYEGEPGAVGWSIALPGEWSLVSVTGPNVPAIIPETGSTGTLEFAYTTVPNARAEFTVLVRYPANAPSAKATPTVLVRAGGKLSTLSPPAVALRGSATSGQHSQN